MTRKDELLTVMRLTGADAARITVNETGWTSRVYLVDGGKTAFKFARNKKERQNLAHEIDVLTLLKEQAFSLAIPRIRRQSEQNEYFGFDGVTGNPLRPETVKAFTDGQKKAFGAQLGAFLKQLHGVKGFMNPAEGTDFDQLNKYRRKLRRARDFLKTRFTDGELDRIDAFFTAQAPRRLAALGQDLVFCHGDFGYNNIVLDERLTPGVIDFGDAGLYDRSKDFIDLDDPTVLDAALTAYGAGETLLEKIRIWQKLFPVFLMLFYIDRKEPEGIRACVQRIKLMY